METRRTNTFLNMALSSRSPARPRYFKSKFHQQNTNTKLNFPGLMQARQTGMRTATGGDRGALKPLTG